MSLSWHDEHAMECGLHAACYADVMWTVNLVTNLHPQRVLREETALAAYMYVGHVCFYVLTISAVTASVRASRSGAFDVSRA